ncbi:MAG: hypothetical protein WCK88_07420 [bacterium]
MIKKKRFSPQKNISLPVPAPEKILEEHDESYEKGGHFETAIKNISKTYHKQKKGNALKNGIFFSIFFLILLSTAAWALPRVLSLQFNSVGSFFSQINPVEVLAPENKEMNVLIL